MYILQRELLKKIKQMNNSTVQTPNLSALFNNSVIQSLFQTVWLSASKWFQGEFPVEFLRMVIQIH